MTQDQLNQLKTHTAELKRINASLQKAKNKEEMNIVLKELNAYIDKDTEWTQQIIEQNLQELKARKEG